VQLSKRFWAVLLAATAIGVNLAFAFYWLVINPRPTWHPKAYGCVLTAVACVALIALIRLRVHNDKQAAALLFGAAAGSLVTPGGQLGFLLLLPAALFSRASHRRGRTQPI
jgi:hypothetical protein